MARTFGDVAGELVATVGLISSRLAYLAVLWLGDEPALAKSTVTLPLIAATVTELIDVHVLPLLEV
jgi:hypothetical protein